MAELTKVDKRQPMGKIKPTDKMVMMQSLFDSTKPAMSKQHYERFNLYINFQTKSGHLTDPVGEAIDLFEHTLDKTALVWFQTNRSKFKDLNMLKMMFLQKYNPWGKAKREQLQSWNILSFNPKTTDVDEHIDLINTLGDMVDQKEEAKKEKFIETMPTMIQTHANCFLLVSAVSGPFTSFLVLHTISWFSCSEVCAFVLGNICERFALRDLC